MYKNRISVDGSGASNDVGVVAIANALASGNSPERLRIDLGCNGIGADSETRIKHGWESYHEIMRGLKAIALIQGERSGDFVTILPTEIRDEIYQLLGMKNYLDYTRTFRSVKRFIRAYAPSSFFYPGWRSDESKLFGAKLENILKNPGDSKTETIKQAISEFLSTFSKTEYTSSSAISLLLESGVIDSSQVHEHSSKAMYYKAL